MSVIWAVITMAYYPAGYHYFVAAYGAAHYHYTALYRAVHYNGTVINRPVYNGSYTYLSIGISAH
ncbi:hypothetical protein GCM10027037_17440 [Mucilaginibacter koreensis]